jgi:hypothetical protein
MTQQQILQLARELLVRKITLSERAQLQNHAMANGRSIVAASKASTMRLAQWARNQKSAI